jgi:hypothetical protein
MLNTAHHIVCYGSDSVARAHYVTVLGTAFFLWLLVPSRRNHSSSSNRRNSGSDSNSIHTKVQPHCDLNYYAADALVLLVVAASTKESQTCSQMFGFMFPR